MRDPDFIDLEFEGEVGTLEIYPADSSLIGKSFAVYIVGNLNVNKTV